MPLRAFLLTALFLAALPVQAEPEHSIAAETAAIRQHHLNRAQARLVQDTETLHQQCRYESEINTRPPAREVVLTFDDGPEPGQTEQILATLKKYEIGGTFFLIGQKARRYPALVEKIGVAGHLIGNHSWSHPNFHDLDATAQADEINQGEAALPTALRSPLFRYPYGNASCAGNDLLHEHNYRIVGWHVDSCDWAFDRTGSVDEREALSCGVAAANRSNFVDHVVGAVRAGNGGIILFHEIHPHTIQQLEAIIVALKNEGFRFARITDASYAASLR